MTQLGGYRLLERVHQTGRRVVWRAERVDDGTAVYVKRAAVAHPSLDEIARFRHEFARLDELDLPGVVRPVELLRDGNGLALVVEDFGGHALSAELNRGHLGVEDLLEPAIALVRAVAELHEAGLLHRDINPSNIAWNPQSKTLKLLDFEFAERIATVSLESQPLLGTLAWISPEQTGRLRQTVDERSDLYSVGATLYALITGHPPFAGADASELVHAHLARRPVPPQAPAPLAEMVLKLLAKHPDERYQSARGLLADLEAFAADPSADLTLGAHDRPTRFRLPKRLYGRDEALALLDQSLARAAEGRLVFLRVSGWSGVGKTALVEAGRGRVVAGAGHFASGKFEQYRRGEPYRALLDALRATLAELLASGETGGLAEALGPNVAVLLDDLPELRALLGPKPAVEELRPTEARNRYEATLLALVAGLASPERPLLLFLDDLQWADPGSLGLLQSLFADNAARGLLAVGAWRDNEVGPDHPLRKTLSAIEAEHGDVVDLHLGPLHTADVQALLADALARPGEEVAELAEHLQKASGGNPFFLKQRLEVLHSEGLIALGERWTWDLDRIRALPLGDDVGSLLAQRLARLDAPCRDALSVAACLGVHVDLSILAAAAELDAAELVPHLDAAAEVGLVQLEGAGWSLLRSGAQGDAVLHFAHDAVQAAAYALTPEDRRPALHLRVARLLGPSLAAEPERLLSVVEHYSRAASLIRDPDERLQVAALHEQAARRALASTAHEAARSLFEGGISLLPEDCWQRADEIAWALHSGACRTATLVGSFDEAAARLDELRAHTVGAVRPFDVFGLDMALNHHKGNLGGVVETGLSALDLLGAGLPRFPSAEGIGEKFAAVGQALEARGGLDGVERGTWTDDPREVAIGRFLFAIGPCAYLTQRSALWQEVCLTLTHRALTIGLTPSSAYGFSGMAMLLSGGMGQHEMGRAFGEAAIAVADAVGLHAMKSVARFMVGGFVVHWTRPLPDAVAVVDEGYKNALASGDVIYAAWSLASGAITTSLAGESLDDAERRAIRMAEFCERHGLQDNIMFRPPIVQFARALRGETRATWSLEDEGFSSAGFVRSMEGRFFRVPLHVFHVLEAHLALLGDRAGAAREALDAAERVLGTSFSMPIIAEHAAVKALTLARLCTGPSSPEWAGLEEAREALAVQAASGPFRHKQLLIDAEIARLRGDAAAALPLYERAMEAAIQLGSHWYAALTAEHAARFLKAAGSPRAASAWTADAAHAWLRFGATARARELGFDPETGKTSRTSTLGSSTTAALNLDMETVLKAARSIAAELELDPLLARLSHLAMENAGAEKAWLLLDGPRGLRLVSHGESNGRFVRLDEALDELKAPSPALVKLVAAGRQPVVVEDAQSDDRFKRAVGVAGRGVRSLMGIPLIHQGRLGGVLVLENTLAPGVFTAGRLELLRILSSQIAVALENASLVDDLRELNAAYARFVPQQFLRFLGKDAITDVRLGDAVERRMTVMFADIRGFTTRSEGRTPSENFEFINDYLRRIGPIIRTHGGFIDKFLGDGIMALFPGAAEDAVRAAIAMQRSLREFNANRDADDGVEIGIGLHRGELMLGTIGEAERMDGTVISDAVNTASRVESLTKEFSCGALITGEVVGDLPGPDSFLLRRLGKVPVKGRTTEVEVFELFDGDERGLREAKWSKRSEFEDALQAREQDRPDEARGAWQALADAAPADRVVQRMLDRIDGAGS